MRIVERLGLAGRIGRLPYGAGVLGLSVAAVAFAKCLQGADPAAPGGGAIALSLLVPPLFVWCLVCLNACRLRDMGRTPWLTLLPFATGLLAKALAAGLPDVTRSGLVLAVNGCFLLALLLTPGRVPARPAAGHGPAGEAGVVGAIANDP